MERAVAMPPVRVKVYGLHSLTRRSYLRQAAAGGAILVLLLFAWWAGWPGLRLSFKGRELPPWMRLTVQVLDNVPWILLGAGVFKAFEMWIVLRAFTRREREAARSALVPNVLPVPTEGESKSTPSPSH